MADSIYMAVHGPIWQHPTSKIKDKNGKEVTRVADRWTVSGF